MLCCRWMDGNVSAGSEAHAQQTEFSSPSHCHGHRGGWRGIDDSVVGGLHIIAGLLKRTMRKKTRLSPSSRQLMSLFRIRYCGALISHSLNF